jgi:hypothetical protein
LNALRDLLLQMETIRTVAEVDQGGIVVYFHSILKSVLSSSDISTFPW